MPRKSKNGPFKLNPYLFSGMFQAEDVEAEDFSQGSDDRDFVDDNPEIKMMNYYSTDSMGGVNINHGKYIRDVKTQKKKIKKRKAQTKTVFRKKGK